MNRLLAACGAAALLLLAACGAPVTTTAAKPAAHHTSATHPKPAARPATQARVGDALTLTGNTAGEKMRVVVVRVYRHAQPASTLDAAPAGKRLVAVQFRLTDIGAKPYSDAPSNSAVVVDSQGQSYQASLSSTSACQSFPGTENIPAGGVGLGCVVFQVPAAAKITRVQFTLDSGFGPVTGEWRV